MYVHLHVSTLYSGTLIEYFCVCRIALTGSANENMLSGLYYMLYVRTYVLALPVGVTKSGIWLCIFIESLLISIVS